MSTPQLQRLHAHCHRLRLYRVEAELTTLLEQAAGLSTAEAADKKYGRDGMPNGWTDSPLTFVSIADDGTVTIVCHRSEMGRARTGMPMIVADELEADWKRVRVASGAGRREEVRQPGHRRLTQHTLISSIRCGAAARRLG